MKKILAAILLVLAVSLPVLADSKLDALSAIVTPAGSDLYYCVQSSTDYKCTLDQVRQWANVAITGGTIAGVTSVGIGATPVNKLDVEGAAAIGATYSGSSTAPTNGLIVEGNVGIGTSGGVTNPLVIVSSAASLVNTFRIQNSTAAASGVGSYISFAGPAGVEKTNLISQYDDGTGNETSFMIQNRTGGTTAERMRIKGANVGIGTSSPTDMLDINSDTIRLRTAKTPASAAAACDGGEIAWDASYIYICIAANTWVRAATATW